MDQVTLEAAFHAYSLDQLHRHFRIGGRVLKSLSKFVYHSLHPFIGIIFNLPCVTSSAGRLQRLESGVETLDLFSGFLLLVPLDVKPDSGKVGVEILFQPGKRHLLIAQRIFRSDR